MGDLAQKAAMLAELAQEVRSCQRCLLASTRTIAVPGEGPCNAHLMFIGEGPGEQEDLCGRPFVGAAGQLLNRLLEMAGLRRRGLFITNIVKCRPPGNRDPQPCEALACRPYLDAQIALVNPVVICLLGKPATHTLLDAGAAMGRVHGIPQEKEGMVYVPLYHPAAALHQPSLQPVLVEDMKRLQEFLRRG